MNLRRKLLFAQLPLGMALLLLCIFTASTLSIVIQNTDIATSSTALDHVREMENQIEKVKDYRDTEVDLKSGRARLYGLTQTFEDHLKTEKQFSAKLPVQLKLLESIEKSWNLYKVTIFEMLDAKNDENYIENSEKLEKSFDAMTSKFHDLFWCLKTEIFTKLSKIRQQADRGKNLVVWGSIIALFFGIFITGVLTRRALQPLSILHSAVKRLSQGDLEVRAQVIGQDEVAQLAQQFNQLAERLWEYRKSSLGELLQAQQASQAAIDSLPDPVLILGNNGQLLNVNRSAETTLELFSSVSTDPLKSLGPLMSAALLRIYHHVLSGKGAYNPGGLEEAVQLQLEDGEHYFLPRANPIYDDQGLISGAAIILQDVTRLHRFDQLKSNLIATLARDLRTPLLSLRMALHICIEENREGLTDKQLELLQGSREDGEKLQSIVEELFELSHLESGRIELKLEPISIEQILKESIDSQQEVAEKNDITIQSIFEIPTYEVLVDIEKLKSTISTLILYMLHNTNSPIVVQAKMHPESTELTRISLRSPTCPDFTDPVEEALEHPEPASEITDASDYRSIFSTAKQMLRAHGGDLGASTEKGCEIWLTLPCSEKM